MSKLRDDSQLVSIICPHCKMGLYMLSPDLRGVTVFRNTKLILLRCTHCEANITENEITDTYRDYTPPDGNDGLDKDKDDEDENEKWDESMPDDFDDSEDNTSEND